MVQCVDGGWFQRKLSQKCLRTVRNDAEHVYLDKKKRLEAENPSSFTPGGRKKKTLLMKVGEMSLMARQLKENLRRRSLPLRTL